MTAVAAITRDIRGLSEAAAAAAAVADWEALERFETIRLDLLNTLGALAADPSLRVQAAEAFRHVQALETSLGAAIDTARYAHETAAGRAIHWRRAGQAYNSASSA